MRKASILLVGFLALVLLASCGPKEKIMEEEPEAPVVTEPEQPPVEPEIPKEEVEKELVKQEDLQPIYFDFDKYNLSPGDREILNRNAQVLKENATVKIRIEGNCDERGTVEYNLPLGENRARAAKDYLVNLLLLLLVFDFLSEVLLLPLANGIFQAKSRDIPIRLLLV